MPNDPHNLGATGQFPYGKLNPNDEGELRLAVAGDRRTETVYIEFGKPVHSIGMRPEEAEAFAETLLKQAHRARHGKDPE